MRLSIPTPCHEDWSAMTPTERGRFCQSCRKEVVDFSGMTDAELVARLRQTSGTVCGRLRADQVERSLLLSSSWNLGQAVRKRMARIYGFAALVAGMLLQSRVAVAQRIAPMVVVPAQRYEESDAQELPREQISGTNSDSLKGYVYDSKTKEPIPFAAVVVYGKARHRIAGAVATIDGFFRLELPGDTLASEFIEISCLGYKKRTLSGSTIRRGDVRFYVELKEAFLQGEVLDFHVPWYKRGWRRFSRFCGFKGEQELGS